MQFRSLDGALSPKVKGPKHEVYHSPPHGAEVENACSYTSSHPCVFIGWCVAKFRIRLHGVVLR